MTKKSKPEPTLDEAKRRLDAYFDKQRRQYPEGRPPKWEDEPAGVIHGNPDTLEDDFDDDDLKPDLKVVQSPKKSNKPD